MFFIKWKAALWDWVKTNSVSWQISLELGSLSAPSKVAFSRNPMMSVQLAMRRTIKKRGRRNIQTEAQTRHQLFIYPFFFSWQSLEKISLLSLENKRMKRFYSNSSKWSACHYLLIQMLKSFLPVSSSCYVSSFIN